MAIILFWVFGVAFALTFPSVYAFLVPHSKFCVSLSFSIEDASEKKGVLAQDETWSGEVLVTEDVVVPEGVTLTIDAGTVVKFKHSRGYKLGSEKIGMTILGALKAVGTPENQIWFTSDAEDAINGDWHMMRFVNAENSTIEYAIIEFAQQGINLVNP
jgi:hypothetical protein